MADLDMMVAIEPGHPTVDPSTSPVPNSGPGLSIRDPWARTPTFIAVSVLARDTEFIAASDDAMINLRGRE